MSGRGIGEAGFGLPGPATFVARHVLRAVFSQRQVRHGLLGALLEDPDTRQHVIHYLSDRIAETESSFERSVPTHLEIIGGFEDCAWLFSSNELNHGVTRLRFDEAAYLYRLVRSLGNPRTVELGRSTGGVTFLLAAAGAHVVSLDDGPGRPDVLRALEAALDRFKLRRRVESVTADPLTYPLRPESTDLVLVHAGISHDRWRRVLDHWWPALRPGGRLLLHGAPSPESTAALRRALDGAGLDAIDEPLAGGIAPLRKPPTA